MILWFHPVIVKATLTTANRLLFKHAKKEIEAKRKQTKSQTAPLVQLPWENHSQQNWALEIWERAAKPWDPSKTESSFKGDNFKLGGRGKKLFLSVPSSVSPWAWLVTSVPKAIQKAAALWEFFEGLCSYLPLPRNPVRRKFGLFCEDFPPFLPCSLCLYLCWSPTTPQHSNSWLCIVLAIPVITFTLMPCTPPSNPKGLYL